MDAMSLFISSRLYLGFLLFAALIIQSYSLNEKFLYCAPKRCGKGPNISYPFRSNGFHQFYCGYPKFDVTCNSDDYPVLTLPSEYLIKDISYSNQSFRLASASLYKEGSCPVPLHNLTLDQTPFSFHPNSLNFSFFYNCTTKPTDYPDYPITCATNSSLYSFALFQTDTSKISQSSFSASCRSFVNAPLHVSSGYDSELLNYTEIVRVVVVAVGSNRNIKLKVIIGAMAVLGTVLTCGFGFLIHKITQSLLAPRKNPDFEAFLEKHGPQDVKRYSYSQVKKMTNSFQEKLGQGGFGSVYKGTLPEGGVVAVKMLSSSEEEGTQGFLNEVAAISRTSHVNIVALLGFCLDTHKRALVYEFMPNGSLDKFICSENGQQLGWEMLHKIAIGIAQGLEYLHRGCNTRIVHFDIKPQNVLLDENLTPKISDFGLAKLCTRKESKVSMLEARGTIGYIAPEVFCINFGQVMGTSLGGPKSNRPSLRKRVIRPILAARSHEASPVTQPPNCSTQILSA